MILQWFSVSKLAEHRGTQLMLTQQNPQMTKPVSWLTNCQSKWPADGGGGDGSGLSRQDNNTSREQRGWRGDTGSDRLSRPNVKLGHFFSHYCAVSSLTATPGAISEQITRSPSSFQGVHWLPVSSSADAISWNKTMCIFPYLVLLINALLLMASLLKYGSIILVWYILYKLQHFSNKPQRFLHTLTPLSTNCGSNLGKENRFFCCGETFEFKSRTSRDLNSQPSLSNDYFSRLGTIHSKKLTSNSTCPNCFFG